MPKNANFGRFLGVLTLILKFLSKKIVFFCLVDLFGIEKKLLHICHLKKIFLALYNPYLVISTTLFAQDTEKLEKYELRQ